MPKTVISVDRSKSPVEQPNPVIVNRWHPDTPIAASVKPGDEFRVECFDWTGGQIKNDDNANDVRDCNLMPCHHLSGAVAIDGAEPGDILVVDILDIGPFQGQEWGYTGIFIMMALESTVLPVRMETSGSSLRRHRSGSTPDDGSSDDRRSACTTRDSSARCCGTRRYVLRPESLLPRRDSTE